MSPERTILCMKWGTKYGPEYINRLYAMVRRQLRGEFRFVCLTDESDGIRAEVQCLPIPDLALPAGIIERGWQNLEQGLGWPAALDAMLNKIGGEH